MDLQHHILVSLFVVGDWVIFFPEICYICGDFTCIMHVQNLMVRISCNCMCISDHSHGIKIMHAWTLDRYWFLQVLIHTIVF